MAGRTGTIALLGSSRFQLGVVPSRLEGRLPCCRVGQLAIDGSSPLTVLADLAQDSSFRGVAVVEVTPGLLFTEDSRAHGTPEGWVGYYHARAQLSDIEVLLRTELQQRFSLLRPGLKTYMGTAIVGGHFPDPPYITTSAQRWQKAHPSVDVADRLVDLWTREVETRGRPLSSRELDRLIDNLKRYSAAIKARGGDVLFLRMVSSGSVYNAERTRFPRDRYWNRLATGLSPHAFHFADEPDLRDFECYDGSHLRAGDAVHFTDTLASLIQRTGVARR